jgi:hypothetical protein
MYFIALHSTLRIQQKLPTKGFKADKSSFVWFCVEPTIEHPYKLHFS